MSDENPEIPVLYYDPTSEPSRAVHWFTLDASIPLQLSYVWLTRNEHRGAAFLAVNPRHQVPALRHGEFCLSEATAIMRYLAETSGESGPWFGCSLQERAGINQLLSWYHTNLRRHGTIEYFLSVLLMPAYLGHAAPPRERVDALRARLRESLEQIERFLEPGPFLAGHRVTVPDLLFASEIFALDCDPDRELYIASLPRMTAWLDRMRGSSNYEKSHKAWNAVVPLMLQRLREGNVPPNSNPGWVAEACERVLM